MFAVVVVVMALLIIRLGKGELAKCALHMRERRYIRRRTAECLCVAFVGLFDLYSPFSVRSYYITMSRLAISVGMFRSRLTYVRNTAPITVLEYSTVLLRVERMGLSAKRYNRGNGWRNK